MQQAETWSSLHEGTLSVGPLARCFSPGADVIAADGGVDRALDSACGAHRDRRLRLRHHVRARRRRGGRGTGRTASRGQGCDYATTSLDVTHALGLALAAGPERWTAMEGGVPVLVDGECIGGVGVSGGDWETDLRIAQAAVESIGASWK